MPSMVLQNRQDSSKFSETTIDNAIKSQMEGGYMHTRRRHTRSQLKKFTTGFTWLTEAERQTLQAFYDTVETWGIFDWTHPITTVVYQVRFESPIKFVYQGAGNFDIYNTDDITLVQV